MNGNDFTGFNEEEVKQMIDQINSSVRQLHSCLTSKVQSNFIDAMKYAWICPDAVKFFEGEFTTAMSSMVNDINTTLRSASEAINSSCTTFANSGGSTWTRKEIETQPFSNYTIRGTILEFDSRLGRGGSLQTFEVAKGQLDGVRSECSTQTEAMKNATNIEAFKGKDVQATLKSAFSTIQTRIDNGFADIINKTNARIKDSIAEFGAIATGAASAFSVK